MLSYILIHYSVPDYIINMYVYMYRYIHTHTYIHMHNALIFQIYNSYQRVMFHRFLYVYQRVCTYYDIWDIP